jgi:phosphatidate cytidylyltransferase
LDASNLTRWQKRLLSGIVLGPAVFCLIWTGGWTFLGFVILCAGICIYEWSKLSLKSEHKVIFLIIGALYIAFSFWTCYHLRARYQAKIALLFLTMIWASDIGAYVTGKSIGGPKMSPAISPNKTWAGFAGATIFPGLAAAVYIIVYDYLYNIDVSKVDIIEKSIAFMAVGVLIGIVGQAGDLLVSWFKRHVEVKDAGRLIPGHGGLLDRVDAMMLASPVFLFIVSKYSDVFPG